MFLFHSILFDSFRLFTIVTATAINVLEMNSNPVSSLYTATLLLLLLLLLLRCLDSSSLTLPYCGQADLTELFNVLCLTVKAGMQSY